MQQHLYHDLFVKLGFNENESNIYEYILTHGGVSAAQIATKLHVTRTNTYHIVDRLIQKGLLYRNKEGGKLIFHAEHPESLRTYITQEERALRNAKTNLESALSDLVSEYSLAEERPGVFRFAGKDGLAKVYQDIISDREDICSIQNREAMRKFIPTYNERWLAQRQQHNLFHRIISVTPTKQVTTVEQDRDELRAVKYIDAKQFPWKMDLKITPRKIVMTTFKRDAAVGISIIDPEIVKNYNFLFEFLWKMLA